MINPHLIIVTIAVLICLNTAATRSTPIRMSAHHQIIEHIVLLHVKPDVDPTKVAAMIDKSNGLARLTAYLSVGKLVGCSHNFTHMLHSRYRSKDDLQAYYKNPEHLHVVAEYIQPVVDDVLIVDWVSSEGFSKSPKPRSAMRVRLLKLKKDLVEHGLVERIVSEFKSCEDVSVGENFSHDLAQGYSIGMIHVFPDLEAVASDSDHKKLHESKVTDFIEKEIVVDYVVQPSHTHN
ncbi:hypothetical protein R6Q59_018862 [Mikania micrantha]